MIGISFKLENEYNNFLFKIFDETGIDNLVWNISNNEIIYKDENLNFSSSIFNDNIIGGREFLKCIQREDYYLIYADIKAFKNESEITNILNYDDFINSCCEIAFLCTDTVNVELYCKNRTVLDNIIKNCRRFEFDEIQVLEKENDGRSEFRL